MLQSTTPPYMSAKAFELAQHSTAQHSTARLASYSKQTYPRRGYLGGLPGTALERHLARWHCILHQPESEHLLLHPLHVTTQPCVDTLRRTHRVSTVSNVLDTTDKRLPSNIRQ